MKAVVAAFNQEKALVGAFSVITNLRMELFEALVSMQGDSGGPLMVRQRDGRFVLVGLVSAGFSCGKPGQVSCDWLVRVT